jgi:hypothetical protein
MAIEFADPAAVEATNYAPVGAAESSTVYTTVGTAQYGSKRFAQ